MRKFIQSIKRLVVGVIRRPFHEVIVKPVKKEMNEVLLETAKTAQAIAEQNNQRLQRIENLLIAYIDTEKLPAAKGPRRDLQMAQLQLLKNFDQLCKDHNLNYWLDFGTMLGAVRHQGFVPWDDDLDVGMMIDDYRKFRKLDAATLEKYGIVYPESWSGPFTKILHSRLAPLTLLGLDIFPYYYQDSDKISATELLQNIHTYIADIQGGGSNPALDAKLHAPVNVTDTRKHIYLEPDFVMYDRAIFKTTDFTPFKMTDFEGIQLPIPANFTKILTIRYKDYYALPKNFSVHSSAIDLQDETVLTALREINS